MCMHISLSLCMIKQLMCCVEIFEGDIFEVQSSLLMLLAKHPRKLIL